MKKNYLVVLGILMYLLPLSVAGQELVWSNSFDTPADINGWIFYDGNGNGQQWEQGADIYYNGTSMVYGSEGCLRYSINLVPSGTASGFATNNDWVISPEIDLSGASGTIQLVALLGRQRTTHASVGRSIWVYESNTTKPVPDVTDFQAMTDTPFRVAAGTTSTPWESSTDVTVFTQSNIVDLSALAGKKIYIGLKSDRDAAGGDVQNINISEIGIYAEHLSANTPVTGVSLNKSTLNLVADVSETLTATVTPADATNKEVTWSSSNEAVATVDAAGKVTAVAVGTATITVTTTDGGHTAKCTVTVTAAIDYSWLKAAAIAVEGNNAKVVGPDADKFTLFYIDNQPATLTNGQADLTGKTGELSLKATTADGSGVIKLKISK